MPLRDPHKTAGMLASGARILLLPCWMIAIGIMLQGYGDIGDGFSAGVIAALGVLLQGLAFGAEELDRMPVSRYAPVMTFIGLAFALLTVFLPLVFGHDLMTHWPGMNHHAITFGKVEFITPVAFDIGVFLVVYGFCVGGVHAVAREEVRLIRMRERLRLMRERRRRDAEGAGE